MKYRAEIDGLRAVAVVPVVFYHAGFAGFSGGYVGVDVFFVISGYLITSILIGDLESGRFSIAGFYERRARRILPALLVVIAACIPVAAAVMVPAELKEFSKTLISVALFASNVQLMFALDYFTAPAAENPLVHTWSLAIEEQFYIIFPVLLFALWRFGRNRVAVLIALLTIASLAACEYGWRVSPRPNFFLLPTRAWELGIGSLCAFVLHGRPAMRSSMVAGAGLALISVGIVAFDSGTPFPSLYALAPTVGAALVILFAGADTRVARVLSAGPLVGIGLISYSLYLWHQPLFAFTRLLGAGEPSLWTMLALIAVNFGLAYLTWRYVEAPFRRRSGRLLDTRRMVFGASLAGLLGIAAIGGVATATDGLIGRYPPEDRRLASLSRDAVGAYVAERFNTLRDAPFPENGKSNLLVVGDSFAQDFVNVLFEAGVGAGYNISTRYISAKCGNLFVDRDLDPFIQSKDRVDCATQGRFDKPAVMAQLRQADAVILVSSWLPWQAALLPETVRNISSATSGKVLVLGRKSFGKFRLSELLDLTPAQRKSLRLAVGERHTATNEMMRSERLPGFVDLQRIVCRDDATCPIFTDKGDLLSLDGSHLTREGARFIGEQLSVSPSPVSFLFSKPVSDPA